MNKSLEVIADKAKLIALAGGILAGTLGASYVGVKTYNAIKYAPAERNEKNEEKKDYRPARFVYMGHVFSNSGNYEKPSSNYGKGQSTQGRSAVIPVKPASKPYGSPHASGSAHVMPLHPKPAPKTSSSSHSSGGHSSGHSSGKGGGLGGIVGGAVGASMLRRRKDE